MDIVEKDRNRINITEVYYDDGKCSLMYKNMWLRVRQSSIGTEHPTFNTCLIIDRDELTDNSEIATELKCSSIAEVFEKYNEILACYSIIQHRFNDSVLERVIWDVENPEKCYDLFTTSQELEDPAMSPLMAYLNIFRPNYFEFCKKQLAVKEYPIERSILPVPKIDMCDDYFQGD